MKRFLKTSLIVLILGLLLGAPVAAMVPYSTYIYDINGQMVASPHAYVPDRIYYSEDMNLATELKNPTDLVSDDAGNLYLADSGNNRIIVYDHTLHPFLFLDSFVNAQGVPDALLDPKGVYVTAKEVFVADSGNNRIVVFGRDGAFVRTIEEPFSKVIPEGSVYTPAAIAVDGSERIYVISSTTHYGIMSLNADGSFRGFLGAQKTTPTIWQLFWRSLQTSSQRKQVVKLVPTEYNNITIDNAGFIYVTTNSIDPSSQKMAISSKASAYSPIKKLNALGNDVLQRTGFFAPAGEVQLRSAAGDEMSVSSIVDVALGENNTWSIVDSYRQRIYTYDEEGKLLFVFGDKGLQLGQLQKVVSICYRDTDILALDQSTNSITVYRRTEYGDFIAEALQNQIENNYANSVQYWKEILQRNANFDQSYIGIGDNLYREGEYEEAMQFYAYAYDVTSYSDSYRALRKLWIEKYVIIIPIVIVALCVGLTKFFKFARKYNLKGQVTKEKRTWAEAFLYVFHLIFHPFDGFWDLKHERRGNFKGAFTILALVVLGFVYYAAGRAYIFNPQGTGVNVFSEIFSVLTPLALWCVSNWCLTTLFDGEGSFKDIVTATCYSLLPVPLMMIPATLLTNILTEEEGNIISLLVTIGYIWAGFLLFFGMMVVHDYSMPKNILTIFGSLVGMAFIMFVGILFSGLLSKVFSFVYNIFVELSYRW